MRHVGIHGGMLHGVRALATSLLLGLLLAPGAASCARRVEDTPVVAASSVPAVPEASKPGEDLREGLQSARKKLADGDEAGAIAVFDELLAALPEAEPRRVDVSCELATLFNNRAERLFAKDARVGIQEIRRARALCPSSTQVTRNLATLLFTQARGEDRGTTEGRHRAIDLLRESLSLFEEQGYAHAVLADCLMRENAAADALEHLRRATELLPTEPSIKARLAELERTAVVEAGFKDNRHHHFVARFEGYAQEKLAWTALDLLEQAYFAVGGKLNVYPREPITVVIYTGDQYKQVTDMPDWAAGSFDGKIRIREGHLLSAANELQSVLRHEYTHAALATMPVQLPAWFNEGLARYFEGDDVASATAWLTKKRGGKAAPWDILELSSFVGLQDPDDARAAYATASLLVHSLIEKRGSYALQTLASRLANGEAFSSAFRSTYAMEPRQHYDAWLDSL